MCDYGHIVMPDNFWERSHSSPPSHTDANNDSLITLVYASPKDKENKNA